MVLSMSTNKIEMRANLTGWEPSDVEELEESSIKKQMTLTNFLSYFDFDYVVYDNGMLGLKDLQGGNLADIENERFANNDKGVTDIIDRLESYYDDYIFNRIHELLNERYNINTFSMTWRQLFEKEKELNLNYDIEIIPYILGDIVLALDSCKKEIKEEYLEIIDELDI